MTFTKPFRLGLALLLVLLSLTACAPSAPAATLTPTEQPTATTAPLLPTETLIPTEVPPTLQADAPPGTPAAGDATAAPTTEGGAAQGGTGKATATVAAKPPASSGAPADKYQYITQSLADRSQLMPNRTITITWAVKNAGTTGWTTDYSLRYFSGVKAAKDYYAFPKVVAAGETVNLSVTFTTPAANGDYNTWWKLTNAQGQNFGDVDFSFTVTTSPTSATSTPKK